MTKPDKRIEYIFEGPWEMYIVESTLEIYPPDENFFYEFDHPYFINGRIVNDYLEGHEGEETLIAYNRDNIWYIDYYEETKALA